MLDEMRLRLSQPSLAGNGAWAKLGNFGFNNFLPETFGVRKHFLLQNILSEIFSSKILCPK